MKQITLLLSVVFLSACSAKLMAPTQFDVDRMSGKYPGYSLGKLAEGKILYETQCGQCHGLKNPAGHNEEQWKEIVPRMVKKVNKKRGGEAIDVTKQETLLRYVITMSTVPKKAK